MMTESAARGIGEIRRYYEGMKVPFCSTARAREDVLQLLEERKILQRAGEALMTAALPYGGDPNLKKAIEDFRAVLERRRS
ncbi:MAG: hypothetical protein ACXVD9_12205 [Actinomycetota bacterium]